MDHLFWGLLFCLIDVEVTVGRAVFGLLPDFIGYFLLMKGMTALAGESRFFDRGRHWAFGLCILSAVLWGAELMDPDTGTKLGLWALELAERIVLLVLIRGIVAELGRPEGLNAMWLTLAVMQPMCHLLGWIPLVGTVCSAASAVVSLLFLAAFRGKR